jgi:tetraacyldisaccharide 4'-kinase
MSAFLFGISIFQYLYAMKNLLLFLLAPLAIFYYLAVLLRNKLFDKGLIKSRSYPVPLICVGNLSTGGTGKTPHTEYITRLLLDENMSVAILSRGYKRKTKGFLIVEDGHTYLDAGDEPCLYKKHFPGSHPVIAVDADRQRGIENLLRLYPHLNAIVLDDAFQHRYVKAGLNIVLTDYYKPFFKDRILPFGNLREPKSAIKRADIVLITKSLSVISPLIRRDFQSKCRLSKNQHLFFSQILYDSLTSFVGNLQSEKKPEYATIFLFTGIANPYPLEDHLKPYCLRLETIRFPDHHNYTVSDIQKILNNFDAHLSTNKILVTTEKDMMRLQSPQLKNMMASYPVFYVPIQVVPDKHDKEKLNKIIIEYVKQNQRNH